MNYMVLDTEATPFRKAERVSGRNMYTYDIGYVIADKNGNVHKSVNYLVQEIFCNASLMKSAYYAEKLPRYYAMLANGEIELKPFVEIMRELQKDCERYNVKRVFAFNAKFDRDTLNATVEHLSNGFRKCFLPYGVKWYDVRMFAKCFTKTNKYSDWCNTNGRLTQAGNPSTTAESVFAYLTKNVNFSESHTALDDAMIELAITLTCFRRHAKQPNALKPF